MLTARGEETDRIVGLELGADDYIVKPFSAREVVARIRAVLRRGRRRAAGRHRRGAAGGRATLRLDRARRSAALAGEELDLTRKEFELLELLMREAGTVVSRERLIDEVWDMNWFGSTKTLDVHVSSLRRKLGDDSAAPRYIHTVRGVGFRFAAPEELRRVSREPACAAAARLRLHPGAGDRRARGAAGAQPLAACRRRGQERGAGSGPAAGRRRGRAGWTSPPSWSGSCAAPRATWAAG